MKDFWKKWQKEIIFGIGILIIAFIVRVYNLTIIPVFADEAIYIRWSQVMRAEQTLRFLPLSDGKQPLFMWVAIPFLKLFEDPLFAGRMVSVLSGMGTLAGIFALTYLLFASFRLSLFAGLMFALSPFSVFFDRLALADSMLSMLGVWFFVFSVLTVKKLRLDTAMVAGFSLGGALLTKSPGIYFALLSPVFLILLDAFKSGKKLFTKLILLSFLFAATLFIATGLYNILRLGPNFHMIAIRNKDYVYPINHIFSSPFDPLIPFLDRIVEYFRIMGPSAIIIIFLIGFIKGIKAYPKETLVLSAFLFLPVIASAEFSKTMTARYVYFSVPYFFIVSALAFYGARKNVKTKKTMPDLPRFVLNLLITIFILHALFIDFRLLTDPMKAPLPRSERSGYLEEWTAGHGIKEISEFLKKEVVSLPAGGQMVVGTEGYFGTLPDGLQIYMNNVPGVTVIGVGQPIREVAESLKESKIAGNKTYLVVNDSRFIGDFSDHGLQLISSFPKAEKPDGSRENLLFLEVAK